MKKAFLFACLSLFLTIAVFSASAQDNRGLSLLVKKLDTNNRAGRQYLLIIAVNKYQSWPPLKNPVKDAKELKDILVSKYYIDDVVELYDEKATKAAIIKAFETYQKKLTANDSLLVYYAGHGHLDPVTNSGFWIPVNAGLDKYEQANWLPNGQIRGIVSGVNATHLLIISDSCFSGDLLNSSRAMPDEINNDYFKRAYARFSRQIITSGASETVPDESEFSRMLKIALRKNNSPYLDPFMLFSEVRLGVHGTMPMFGNLKDTGHQDGASFLLFMKDAEPQEIARKEEPKKIEPKKIETATAKIEEPKKTEPPAVKKEEPKKTEEQPSGREVAIFLKSRDAQLISNGNLRRDSEDVIVSWGSLKDQVKWSASIPEDGAYSVSLRYSCVSINAGSTVIVSIGEQSLEFRVRDTGSKDSYVKHEIGKVTVNSGTQPVVVKVKTKSYEYVMNLTEIILVKTGEVSANTGKTETAKKEDQKPAEAGGATVTITLQAGDARIVTHAMLKQANNYISGWRSTEDQILWTITVPEDGEYDVYAVYACTAQDSGSLVALSVDKQSFQFSVRDTGGWENTKKGRIGKINLPAGTWGVRLQALNTVSFVMNFSAIIFEKAARK